MNSKFLLEYRCDSDVPDISFPPDGRFLACSCEQQVYLWKESPAGYTLHGTFPPAGWLTELCFSQDGKSLITWGDHIIRLWHTESPNTYPSTKAQFIRKFVLDFCLDRMVAVVAKFNHNVVTIIDLEDGTPQLTIDTDMSISGLGVIGSGVFVIGEKSPPMTLVTWDLPKRGCVQNARVSCEDSSGAVELTGLVDQGVHSASISPDFNLVGLIGFNHNHHLITHNVSTGEQCDYGIARGYEIQFSPDGCDIWCAMYDGAGIVWAVGDRSQQPVVGIEDPPEGYPWVSPYGYQVTNDWWILGPDGKRLLMLPIHWQSDPIHWKWRGQFLSLLHGGLPEAVVLELDL